MLVVAFAAVAFAGAVLRFLAFFFVVAFALAAFATFLRATAFLALPLLFFLIINASSPLPARLLHAPAVASVMCSVKRARLQSKLTIVGKCATRCKPAARRASAVGPSPDEGRPAPERRNGALPNRGWASRGDRVRLGPHAADPHRTTPRTLPREP